MRCNHAGVHQLGPALGPALTSELFGLENALNMDLWALGPALTSELFGRASLLLGTLDVAFHRDDTYLRAVWSGVAVALMGQVS